MLFDIAAFPQDNPCMLIFPLSFLRALSCEKPMLTDKVTHEYETWENLSSVARVLTDKH